MENPYTQSAGAKKAARRRLRFNAMRADRYVNKTQGTLLNADLGAQKDIFFSLTDTQMDIKESLLPSLTTVARTPLTPFLHISNA